jgi:protein-L-isoaspartate(D-aspartate) O-methyltransferase
MGNPFDRGKKRMIADIQREVQYTRTMIGKDALDERVMQAMKEVPRDAFVPNGMKMRAFDNAPLPIGHGQTISQPYIVALMTDLLEIKPEDTVLEIGSGSGYQTAILSRLCKQVYSLEVIPELSASAGRLLEQLGYDNIEMRSGNGFDGWPDNGPYDGIIVTAAAPYIPDALFDQLKPGGRLVIPVGLPYNRQELMAVTKDERGEMQTKAILGVAFVPMVDSRLNLPRNKEV